MNVNWCEIACVVNEEFYLHRNSERLWNYRQKLIQVGGYSKSVQYRIQSLYHNWLKLASENIYIYTCVFV